ncbi:MAG: DUF3089 domain-containing protein [Sphingomonadales bacterium]|nr:DUF3089 domain-containing protein [Sphingomonadales bacterium]
MLTTAAAAAALGWAMPAAADHHEGASADTPDYSLGQNWLCAPGRRDACSLPLAVTDVAADGTLTERTMPAAEDPAFDCFYVYPTVSNDPTPHSDMIDNEEERRVAVLQAAPFRQVCRVFAPLYRQVTLTALRQGMATGNFDGVDREMTYRDVKAAWDEYLASHNNGRGVLLIGHSQGSGVLANLIARDIDGHPAAERLIAAYLIGWSLAVREGADVGGQFRSIPLCREPGQTGCLVNFVSFRDTVPPPAHARFGRVEGDGMIAACTNPASLSGGSAPLDGWLSNAALTSSSALPPWTSEDPEIATPYVRVPGLLSGECVSEDGFSYLKVTVHGDPADPRTDDISGDVVFGGQRLDDWGLHLIDMNLTMGNLVALAEQQGAAWNAARE